jgi:putative FmdB family regulatory protein
MPIYEFECSTCGTRFDRLQKLSDPDPDTCPECGASSVRRNVTAPSFRLSGSGWYETDFKKDGDKKRNLVDKTDSASSGSESASKGEAKPAPSTDTGKADSKPKSSPAEKPATPAKPAPKPAEK